MDIVQKFLDIMRHPLDTYIQNVPERTRDLPSAVGLFCTMVQVQGSIIIGKYLSKS